MNAPTHSPAVPPIVLTWRQSGITAYLKCPRSYEHEHVLHTPRNLMLSGYAGPKGTALHAGAAALLNQLTRLLTREQLSRIVLKAFDVAIDEANARGEIDNDPKDEKDAQDAAMDELEGEGLDLLLKLQDDERIRAIDWLWVERPFARTDSHGRKYSGTIDAVGIARRDLWLAPGVFVRKGELIICDWKTGTKTPLMRVELSLNVQAAFYRMEVGRQQQTAKPPRFFLGNLRDLGPPQHPKDANGEIIPKRYKVPNPLQVAALARRDGWAPNSITEAELLAKHEENTKHFKAPNGVHIPKWLKGITPAWLEAQKGPRGPLFHECPTDWEVVLPTIKAAIKGAEMGLFPASGALTGQCRFCPYRGSCANANTKENE